MSVYGASESQVLQRLMGASLTPVIIDTSASTGESCAGVDEAPQQE